MAVLNSIKRDSPWCWLIVAGNAVIAILVVGLPRSWAVFYPAIMNEFQVDNSAVALISALNFAGNAVGALLLPILTRRYGSRKTGMVAGFIFGLSLFISSFARHIILLHIFQGAITGFCGGILLYGAAVSFTVYFVKYRSLAANLTTLGMPIGTFVFPPVLDYLVQEYGWRSTILIISAVALHTIVALALYRPLHGDHDISGDEASAGTEESQNGNVIKRACSVFSIPTYSSLLAAAVLFAGGSAGANLFIVPFGAQQLQLTSLEAAFLLTLASAGECVAKIVFGVLGDVKWINRLLLMVCTDIITAVFYGGIALCQSYAAAATVAFFQGFFAYPHISLIMVIYGDAVGSQKVSFAIGWHGFIGNGGRFLTTYLLGLSLDLTHDARVPFYICSGLVFISALLLILSYLLQRPQKRKQEVTDGMELKL